jgi:hypothetical protein
MAQRQNILFREKIKGFKVPNLIDVRVSVSEKSDLKIIIFYDDQRYVSNNHSCDKIWDKKN